MMEVGGFCFDFGCPRRSESEEEEEEEVVVESDDEPQKKRKSSSKKPAPKKARTEYTIEEHEKGTIKRPTENTITSTGAFNGEFAFALGTVCSVLCEKTNRWVTGHVIMFHRGGVTTKYAVKAVRVLFEKAQHGGKTQKLGDGNWLVLEPQPGRVFEVDAEGRTVWEWGHERRSDGVSISEVLGGNSYQLTPAQLDAIRSR